MISVKKPDILSYHPEMSGELLNVEKGWSHYSHEGQKDFLDYILAYQPEADGISFQVRTFRGRTALVKVQFAGETVFRFRMFPTGEEPETQNAVFDFPTAQIAEVQEAARFFTVSTSRLKLSFRKCPCHEYGNIEKRSNVQWHCSLNFSV